MFFWMFVSRGKALTGKSSLEGWSSSSPGLAPGQGQ